MTTYYDKYILLESNCSISDKCGNIVIHRKQAEEFLSLLMSDRSQHFVLQNMTDLDTKQQKELSVNKKEMKRP